MDGSSQCRRLLIGATWLFACCAFAAVNLTLANGDYGSVLVQSLTLALLSWLGAVGVVILNRQSLRVVVVPVVMSLWVIAEVVRRWPFAWG